MHKRNDLEYDEDMMKEIEDDFITSTGIEKENNKVDDNLNTDQVKEPPTKKQKTPVKAAPKAKTPVKLPAKVKTPVKPSTPKIAAPTALKAAAFASVEVVEETSVTAPTKKTPVKDAVPASENKPTEKKFK